MAAGIVFGAIGTSPLYATNLLFFHAGLTEPSRDVIGGISLVIFFAALGLPLVSSSDCHFLGDMGSGSTMLEVSEPSFDEIVMALRMVEGRGCAIA